MTPTEAKLKVVRDWSKPQNVRDIRSFLGLRQLLQMVRQELCRRSGPIDGFELGRMCRGNRAHISDKPLQQAEGRIMHCRQCCCFQTPDYHIQ